MRRPLCFAGLVFLLFQLAAAFLPQVALLPLAAFLVVLFLLVRHTGWEYKQHIALVFATGALAFLYFVGYTALFVNPLAQYCAQPVYIEGTVEETSASYRDGYVTARLRVDTVDETARRLPFTVQVYTFPECETGTRFACTVQLTQASDTRAAQGVFLTANGTDNFSVLGENNGFYYRLRRLQQVLSTNLRNYVQGTAGQMLAAMTLGDGNALSSTVRDTLRVAGLSHIVVVSGMHLSVLGMAVYGAMLYIFKRRRLAAGCAAAATVLFMLVTGFTPSLVRAGIAMLLVFITMFTFEKADALTSLGLAALVLMLQNPYSATNLSLLFSFSATLGVLLVAAVDRRWRWTHVRPSTNTMRLHKVLLAICVPLAATAATLPVSIYAGYGVSVLGIVCNLFTVFLLPFVLIFGLIASVCFTIPILVWLAQPIGLVAGLLVRYIYAVARTIQQLPGMVYVTGWFALLSVVLFYLVAFVAWRTHAKHGALCAVAVLVVAFGIYGALDSGVVHIAAAGSGERTALVLHTEGKTAVIYRGGEENLAAIRETMQQWNCTQVDVLVDLRRSPDDGEMAQALGALQTVVAENGFRSQTPLKSGTIITVVHQVNGNLACIECGSYKIVITCGKVQMQGYSAVDVYYAGGEQPQDLDAATIWNPSNPAEQEYSGREIAVRSSTGTVRFKEEINGNL